MKVSVLDFVGPRCIVAADGQRLHDEIVGSLQAGEPVCLDFSGVKLFASPFFNYAIGQLLNEISEPDLRGLLCLEGLSDVGRSVVDVVVANAVKYQSGGDDYKRIVEDILARQAEGDE